MNDSFILYTSYYAIIEGLTDEQLGQLTRALFIYARDGEVTKLEPVVRMAFSFIKDNIDRNADKYQKKCERLRANAKKRWEKQMNADAEVNANASKSMLYDNDNDNEYDNDNDVSNETINKGRSLKLPWQQVTLANQRSCIHGKERKECLLYHAVVL